MEAEEEHDGIFDNPIPFDSQEAAAAIRAQEAKPTTTSREISVSCDTEAGADHFVYADPELDKAHEDVDVEVKGPSPVKQIETKPTEAAASTSCEVSTSTSQDFHKQRAKEPSPQAAETDIAKMFEREMSLGSKLENHIPSFILEGLNKLRAIQNVDQLEETKTAPGSKSQTSQSSETKPEEIATDKKNVEGKQHKDDGRIND